MNNGESMPPMVSAASPARLAPALLTPAQFAPALLDPEQVAHLARMVGLDVPASDLQSVTLRLAAIIEGMQAVEHALGARMDAIEPLPPLDFVQWPIRAADNSVDNSAGNSADSGERA